MPLQTEIENLIDRMDTDVDAAVVEGKRDREALEGAGFDGRIYTCSENTDGLASLAATLTSDAGQIAVLTDFDEEGRKLCSSLKRMIPGRYLNRVWRKKLGKLLTARGHRDVESINNIVENPEYR